MHVNQLIDQVFNQYTHPAAHLMGTDAEQEASFVLVEAGIFPYSDEPIEHEYLYPRYRPFNPTKLHELLYEFDIVGYVEEGFEDERDGELELTPSEFKAWVSEGYEHGKVFRWKTKPRCKADFGWADAGIIGLWENHKGMWPYGITLEDGMFKSKHVEEKAYAHSTTHLFNVFNLQQEVLEETVKGKFGKHSFEMTLLEDAFYQEVYKMFNGAHWFDAEKALLMEASPEFFKWMELYKVEPQFSTRYNHQNYCGKEENIFVDDRKPF